MDPPQRLHEVQLKEIEAGSALQREELDLSLCDIGDEGALQLREGLQSSGVLRSLILKQCGLSAAGFATLGAMLSASAMPLENLVLSGNLGGPDALGSEFLAGLKKTAAIKSLSLASCGIGPAGVEGLAQYLKAQGSSGSSLFSDDAPKVQVTFLDLSDNKLGAEGARHLKQLLSLNTSLRELDVSTNSLGQEGGHEVLDGLRANRRRLLKLNLSYNSIGFDASLALVQFLVEQEVSFNIELNLPRQCVGSGIIIDPDAAGLVTEVIYLGPCHIWNEEQPARNVQVGDHVTEVNGRTDPDEMVELLTIARNLTLNIAVKRKGQGFEELDLCHNGISYEGLQDIRYEVGVDARGTLQGWLLDIKEPARKLWVNAA